jgi:AraC-like DNA-binding protein
MATVVRYFDLVREMNGLMETRLRKYQRKQDLARIKRPGPGSSRSALIPRLDATPVSTVRLRQCGWRRNGQKVLDIALDCGFGDVSNFNRAFPREFGMSPGYSKL